MPPPDHVRDDSEYADSDNSGPEDNNNPSSIWLRLLFMILFLALWSISRVVIFAVVVLQFFWVLLSGQTNSRLSQFGLSLATYSYQIVRYLTFDSDEQPFPFDDWPNGPPK
jgi:hypothetical protein